MESGWRNKVVCIIDDDENVRMIYHAKFTNEGFTVITARNGEEGLALIRRERPDIILLDLQMPVLDGIGVLRILKQDAQLSGIPVVILSNIDNDEVFQQVEELASARYYLIKSLTETEKVVDLALTALAEQ